jgi:hypothetical protein
MIDIADGQADLADGRADFPSRSTCLMGSGHDLPITETKSLLTAAGAMA